MARCFVGSCVVVRCCDEVYCELCCGEVFVVRCVCCELCCGEVFCSVLW